MLLPPYGGPIARALTAASIEFLSHTPSGFWQFRLTSPRDAIVLASATQLSLLERWQADSCAQSDAAVSLSADEVVQHVPILNRHQIAAALLLQNVHDIDSAGLLQG